MKKSILTTALIFAVALTSGCAVNTGDFDGGGVSAIASFAANSSGEILTRADYADGSTRLTLNGLGGVALCALTPEAAIAYKAQASQPTANLKQLFADFKSGGSCTNEVAPTTSPVAIEEVELTYEGRPL